MTDEKTAIRIEMIELGLKLIPLRDPGDREDAFRTIAILALGGPHQLAEWACQDILARQEAHNERQLSRNFALVQRAREALLALGMENIRVAGKLEDMIRLLEAPI